MQVQRTRIRNLFLRLLGALCLIAFLSLWSQLEFLVGDHGLLPARPFLDTQDPVAGFLRKPTLFWFHFSSSALHVLPALGVLLSLVTVFLVAPRYCLVGIWVLYLSLANLCREFFSFQWDNLLLESLLFAVFVAPGGVRPRPTRAPHPAAVFLVLWLVFRLHVESGAAKLLSGDSSWRDLTAMVEYYETAPLPTWVGWYAHQLPVWVHKACVIGTYVVELVVPLFIWGSRRLRGVAFLLLAGFQVAILLTANYAFFNYLSIVLCLFVLDDSHLPRALRGAAPNPVAVSSERSRQRLLAWAVAVAVMLVSLLPFSRFLPPVLPEVPSVRRVLSTFRVVNAYHLFATMIRVRREAVIEGSADGASWHAYEFRFKPDEPTRAPRFVAPHQPRVDFRLWFLLLGRRWGAGYFDTLLQRLLTRPDVVRPLFRTDPFPEEPPRFVRVMVYRYWFTDAATRQRTGAWWRRQLVRRGRALSTESFRRR